MYTIQFNREDLEANQQGTLSTDQQERLEKHVARLRREGRWAIWGSVALFIFLSAVGINNEYNAVGRDLNKLLSPTNLIVFAVVGLALGGVMTFALIVNAWILHRYSQGRLRTVEGRAHLRAQTVRGSTTYSVTIQGGRLGEVTFYFANQMAQGYFREGQMYRVYYLPYTVPQVLSLESL